MIQYKPVAELKSRRQTVFAAGCGHPALRAKLGRPKVPMRRRGEGTPPYVERLNSIKAVIHKVNCRIAAREGGLGHAPGFYDFALQNLFHVRFARETQYY